MKPMWLPVISFFYLIILSETSLQAQSLKVMTYNLRFDNPGDSLNAWPFRKDKVAALVEWYGPEILGTQECLHHQLEDLVKLMPQWQYVGVGRDHGDQRGEYAALFFRKDRFQLLDQGTFWLSPTPEQPSKGWDAALPRVCTYAVLKPRKGGKKLLVLNAHFDHIGKEARKQSAQLMLDRLQLLQQKYQALPVVMGDFNAAPEEAPIQVLNNTLQDTYTLAKHTPYGPKGTFNAFQWQGKFDKRIDYIFVSAKNFEVLRVQVIGDYLDQRFPSDHFPVMAELKWK